MTSAFESSVYFLDGDSAGMETQADRDSGGVAKNVEGQTFSCFLELIEAVNGHEFSLCPEPTFVEQEPELEWTIDQLHKFVQKNGHTGTTSEMGLCWDKSHP